MKKIVFQTLIFAALFILNVGFAQQRADDVVIPEIEKPRFKKNTGPIVYIDQSHQNFHQKSGRFKPFSELLTSDGYKVDSIINLKKLNTNDILVIANPIHSNNVRNWRRPIHSAFTEKEILYLKNWVEKGGKLLLIADHMPFAGASNSLANTFGFNFCDGFAYLNKESRNLPDIFSTSNKRLLDTDITDGTFGNKINAITTFTGSAFTIPEKAKGILQFKKDDYCLVPEIAWQFSDSTPNSDLENSYQGAILNFGKGKVAVFGEAAMFTAQTITNNSGTFRFGFHSSDAPNNIQFIRNVLYWLSKK
ncbi:hypothetical protein FDT66_01615 [Polaribacter aestuariivivens]|uniref:DUF4350 domain-containing protein n=1 Tax=Polaribacter aestuariivivens TaxID=2304626 RepID=A0A5S3NA53_9FLAO|nr:hypothetical protein [Polaribacter aestuariivivens]TMM32188.1 hypothetical protein FDT66_01615 [Polaribacter aestuariivivens]